MLLIMLRVGIVLLCAAGLIVELSIALPRTERRRMVHGPVRWLKTLGAEVRAERAAAAARAGESAISKPNSIQMNVNG